MELGDVAVHRDRPADELDRLLAMAGLVSHEPQQVQGVGLVRLAGQHLPVERLGLVQAALAVKCQRRFDLFVRGGHGSLDGEDLRSPETAAATNIMRRDPRDLALGSPL